MRTTPGRSRLARGKHRRSPAWEPKHLGRYGDDDPDWTRIERLVLGILRCGDNPMTALPLLLFTAMLGNENVVRSGG